ncbi:MAG: DUF294 nucleotidyltransferase-like domain-containing protein [Acidobacteriota bacterium]
MNTAENLARDLPDPDSAGRFLRQLSEQHPSNFKKLQKKEGLLSDVLTLVSYSPLIATTLLQNPEYFWWLDRKRRERGIRTKEELLESLARFSLTNSQVPYNILLARFRRRELTRIFLADIRRLLTIAEITEGISNLADAILENAVRFADQELQNRYGMPQQIDDKGRQTPAAFAVVSLGKLGSRELNYSSDIDLLFIYSEEGTTSTTGTRDSVTNREYFSKLAENVSRLVGSQTGEGAAYRVDLRLRPHGRVGPLAMSVDDTVRYYTGEAHAWERQVLIRSRASAGNAELFQRFFSQVESTVFSTEMTVEQALANVRNSKQKIDVQNRDDRGYDVKLGRGGIREIEFIAQALQLAYGGRDRWLRTPHTLISLSRLADRGLLDESEITQLYDAYNFLRRLEHVLQMENGLQTHTVPNEHARRLIISTRMHYDSLSEFESILAAHSANVRRIFDRVFAAADENTREVASANLKIAPDSGSADVLDAHASSDELPREIQSSLEKSDVLVRVDPAQREMLAAAIGVSPRITAMISAAPQLINEVPRFSEGQANSLSYLAILMSAVEDARNFGERIAGLRRAWSKLHFELMVLDAAGKVSLSEVKLLQTRLAEASIAAALRSAQFELSQKLGHNVAELPMAIMGLGKLGSGGIDYDSDLDLIIVHGDVEPSLSGKIEPAELFAKAVEYFVTALSSVTRDGSLYRIDLRLRPYGRNGRSVIAADGFVEYVEAEAAIWELLAFVKLRHAGGDQILGRVVEAKVRDAVHRRALDAGRQQLSEETLRIRTRLEQERSGTRNSRDIDIKFGPGGMLDIYFAVRYLQLRDNVPDDDSVRSTGSVLTMLRDRGSLGTADFEALNSGYEFLSALDHELRLTFGRTTRLPHENHSSLPVIARRMSLASNRELLEALSIHRIEIRGAFERVVDV